MANGRIVQALRVLDQPMFEPRPGLPAGGRDECRNGERPCPYVRCKFHLWREDPQPRAGRLRPGQTERPTTGVTTIEPRWLEYPTPPCCALDIAEMRERLHPGELLGYGAIAYAINRSEDRPPRILKGALVKLGKRIARDGSGGGGDSKP